MMYKYIINFETETHVTQANVAQNNLEMWILIVCLRTQNIPTLPAFQRKLKNKESH